MVHKYASESEKKKRSRVKYVPFAVAVFLLLFFLYTDVTGEQVTLCGNNYCPTLYRQRGDERDPRISWLAVGSTQPPG